MFWSIPSVLESLGLGFLAQATTLAPINVEIDNNPRPLKIFLYLFIILLNT
ncbi:hypothetical protein OM999_02415 [Mycoplasmopsis cynos]|uniref:hypothetical protein n=1 Tax=Mycoplasmopsis cynos TaxID=171284 RepID=UPI0024C91262|nr:hypothetical protein [Mycoplasmopsis cynos]WAM06055.1 hypothetical protein OM999_02415 [Mycoplasmopsis cynos]WAM08696.1 hypothetical protein ONA03_04205 [Mycoplasmopsis cynos]